MEHEYKDLKSQSIESGIIFYGLECCKPNYTYKGNNVRKNYVIHYIEEGKGTFSSAGRPLVQLQAGDCFILPQGVPCFYQADSKDPWNIVGLGFPALRSETFCLVPVFWSGAISIKFRTQLSKIA